MPVVEFITKEIPISCQQNKSAATDSCVANLESGLYRAVEALGFEYVRYTCWVQEITGEGNFPHSFSFNYSNFPVKWENIYESQQLYLHDPVVRALGASNKQKIIYGTWIDAWNDAELAAKEADDHIYARQIRELATAASQHGINSGLYMMINNGLRRIVVSLGSSRSANLIESQVKDGLFQVVFSIVTLMYQSLDLTNNCQRCIKSMRVEGGKAVKLTQKQAKILETFIQNPGATNGEVAKIHFVTSEAIAFHLKAIRQKFRKPHASGHALSRIAKSHGLI